MPRSLERRALLGATIASIALLAPDAAAATVLLVLAVALRFWRRHTVRSKATRALLAIVVAAAVSRLGAALLVRSHGAAWEADGEGVSAVASVEYEAFWRRLEKLAEAAATAVPEAPGSGFEERLRTQLELSRLLEKQTDAGPSLALADPDGELVVWAGILPPEELTMPWTSGPRQIVSGFANAGFWVVRSLPRAGQVAVGMPASSETLPFSVRGSRSGRWRIASPDSDRERQSPPMLRVRAANAPILLATPGAPSTHGLSALRGLAWFLLAMWWCLWSAQRLVASALFRETSLAARAPVAGALGGAAAALGCAALAFSARPAIAAAAAFGIGCLAAASSRSRGPRRDPRRFSTLARVASLLLVLLALGILLREAGPVWGRLVEELTPLESALLRAGVCGIVLALFARFADSAARIAGTARIAQIAQIVQIARIGTPPAGEAPAHSAEFGRFFRAWVLVALALSIFTLWAERRLASEEARLAVQRLAPANTSSEIDALEAAIRRSFDALDLSEVGPARIEAADTRDMAFALWRGSPLSRPNLAAALTVERDAQPISSFAVGLPMDRGGLDPSPAAWRNAGIEPSGLGGLVEGGVSELLLPLFANGQAWGTARIWFRPRSGYLLPAAARRPAMVSFLPGEQPLHGLPADALAGDYDRVGGVRRAPWSEAERLSPRLLESAVGAEAPVRVLGPEGRIHLLYSAEHDRGFSALFLPALDWATALESVGVGWALTLAPWGVLILFLGMGALRRGPVRDALRRVSRSYSQRLVVVFSLLAVAPIAIVVWLGVGLVERHLERETRAEGLAALASAERVLGEYLQTLEPGFGLSTTLDDSLLTWLAGVVRSDVNLYWGNKIYASSRRDLLSAGLLPRRLPGEVVARLMWAGDGVASRRGDRDARGELGEGDLVEVYAPLRLPESADLSSPLVLSVPRLSQEAGAAREVDRARRRALVLALGLTGLIAWIGGRLARGFTRPIRDLVAGTQRIAAGARATGLTPQASELHALALAIDRMAGRIAETRGNLLAEKNLVETVVENIGAGVATLDEHGRVVLCNRAARALLHIEIGEGLLTRLQARSEFDELAAWIRSRLADPRKATRTAQRMVASEGLEREISVGWVPVPGDASNAAAILVVEDVSEVLAGQRLLAWAEMARLIAHEIKNPLTPIRLSAEHLREVHARDPAAVSGVLERCVQNILRQVEQLREIAGEFSTYSRIPEIRRQAGDLRAVVLAVAEGYADAPGGEVQVTVRVPPSAVVFEHDARLIERALRNLVENARRASPPNAAVEIDLAESADGGVSGASGAIVLSVADRGPGVAPHMLERIFEPYFSTYDAGTGLGLPIARRIVEAHEGSLEATARPGGGLIVRARLRRSER